MQRAASGPGLMPQALKTQCLIQFWSWGNSLFWSLALWGNKNWPPSLKVKKFEKYQNKRGSTCCKWPNLNTPGTQTPQYHPIPELTKPNLTPQQSSHTTAIFHPRIFSNWPFDFRFRLRCQGENSPKFSHALRPITISLAPWISQFPKSLFSSKCLEKR